MIAYDAAISEVAVDHVDLQVSIEAAILCMISQAKKFLEKCREWFCFFYLASGFGSIFGNEPGSKLLIGIRNSTLYAIPADHSLGNTPFLSCLFWRNVVHVYLPFELVKFESSELLEFARNF